MAKLIESRNLNECIYSYEWWTLIKDRMWYTNEQLKDIPYFKAIYGKYVDDERVKCKLSPDTMYIFRFTSKGDLLPAHVTYTQQTLNNFEKTKKRFREAFYGIWD